MSTSSPVVVLVALAATCVSSQACTRTDINRVSRVTTNSASLPRADRMPAQSRTIDNTGFVDNGGRTSEQWGRPETSGMRATEAGSERPTGTASGVPLPIEASAPRGDTGEGAGAASSVRGNTGPVAAGAPPTEAIGRLARARCDRESACNRVGNGRAWGSQEACVADHRDRAREDVASLGCRRGVDATQLATCLNALRLQVCSESRQDLDVVPECRTSALCVP
jgi:hypothetical protein